MIEASIKACLGDDCESSLIAEKNLTATSYVVHSMKTGTFKKLKVHEELKNRIIKSSLFVSEGDEVRAFRNGGDSIGAMVIAFDSVEKMNKMMDEMWKYVEVVVE